MTDDPAPELDVAAYLDRIGLDPDRAGTADLPTLERLQRAHLRSVPFENLAAVGDPFGEASGPGVELSVPAVYGKVVTRDRGGHCYELNGLFQWLLRELGYDARLVAARMTDGDDDPILPPANHAAVVVDLGERYVVEVGTLQPVLRRPIPFEGPAVECPGAEWRVRDSDRPDETHRVEVRRGDGEWTTHYVFSDRERDLSYFRAANDYFTTAPESSFADDPWVAVATAEGYRKLSGTTLTVSDGDERERTIPGESAWYATLRDEFGLAYDPGG